jgi:hypothetical protein
VVPRLCPDFSTVRARPAAAANDFRDYYVAAIAYRLRSTSEMCLPAADTRKMSTMYSAAVAVRISIGSYQILTIFCD